jgi:hypothetical protein
MEGAADWWPNVYKPVEPRPQSELVTTSDVQRQGTFLLDIGRRTVVTVNLQLSRKCGASVHLLWLPSRAISTANCNINDAMETLTNNHQGGFPFLD